MEFSVAKQNGENYETQIVDAQDDEFEEMLELLRTVEDLNQALPPCEGAQDDEFEEMQPQLVFKKFLTDEDLIHTTPETSYRIKSTLLFETRTQYSRMFSFEYPTIQNIDPFVVPSPTSFSFSFSCSWFSQIERKNGRRKRFSLVNLLSSVYFTDRRRGRAFLQRQSMMIQDKRKRNLGILSSSMATLTFPLFLLSAVFTHPCQTQQGSHTLLLTLFTLFNFVAFMSAVSVMIMVGARFSRLQLTGLLLSTMALNIGLSDSLIFTLLWVPMPAILFAVWYSQEKSIPI